MPKWGRYAIYLAWIVYHVECKQNLHQTFLNITTQLCNVQLFLPLITTSNQPLLGRSLVRTLRTRAYVYTLHTQNDNDQITMAARIEEAGRIAEVIFLYDR